MIHRSRLIWGLLLVVGLVIGPVAWAEMIVKTKEGKTYRLPLNSDELESIRFVDQAAGRPPKPAPPPSPEQGPVRRPQGAMVIDVWNSGGCSFTDQSDFVLSERLPITGLITWRNWPAGEKSVNYELYKNGRRIHSDTFSRGDCDSNQATWCEGISRLKGSLGPGQYQVRVAEGRICRNSASGSGFIRVYSSAKTTSDEGPVKGYVYTPDAAISGHNRKHLTSVSPDDCAAACDRNPWCVSFDYYKGRSACDLSDKRAGDVGGLTTNYQGKGYDHYSKR
jgi:hypothetical protein